MTQWAAWGGGRLGGGGIAPLAESFEDKGPVQRKSRGSSISLFTRKTGKGTGGLAVSQSIIRDHAVK
jgi:hypothetical protein